MIAQYICPERSSPTDPQLTYEVGDQCLSRSFAIIARSMTKLATIGEQIDLAYGLDLLPAQEAELNEQQQAA